MYSEFLRYFLGKQITGTIDRIVTSSASSEEVFGHVSARLSETGPLVSEVDNAIKEQQAGAGQILEALRVMKDITGTVKTGSESMSQGSDTMLKEMNKLQRDSQEISGNLEKMGKSIAQINRRGRTAFHPGGKHPVGRPGDNRYRGWFYGLSGRVEHTGAIRKLPILPVSSTVAETGSGRAASILLRRP
ncbi:MAG: hypothetical protein LBF78_06455 [Treponema sp.]|jgi:hypothetical protein|nr:hypothetical protein [Treponema sp.]